MTDAAFAKLRLVAFAALPAFAILAQGMAPAGGLLDVTGHAIGRDFVNVWVGSRLVFAGSIETLFDLPAYRAALAAPFGSGFQDANWWAYPPHAVLFFAPFGALPYLVGLALWTFGLGIAMGATLLAQIPPAARWKAALLVALAPSTLVNAGSGQTGALTAALLIGGVAALDRRPILAGVLFGALTVKPHLGILIPFCLLAIGAGRAIVAAVLTALALAAASAALFGVEFWRLYLETAGDLQHQVLTRGAGLFVAMTPTVYRAVQAFAGTDAAAVAQTLAAVIVVPLAVLSFRRAEDAATRALVLASGTPLVAPYLLTYDLTFLSAAIIWWAFTRAIDRRALALLLPAFAAPSVVTPVALLTGVQLGPLAVALSFAVACAATVGHRSSTPRAAGGFAASTA